MKVKEGLRLIKKFKIRSQRNHCDQKAVKMSVPDKTRQLWEKYSLDFRAIRYPGIVGSGLRATGISAIIEMSVKGKPFTVRLRKEVNVPLLYVEDAGRAIIQPGKTPSKNIKSVVYFINGVKEPVPICRHKNGTV